MVGTGGGCSACLDKRPPPVPTGLATWKFHCGGLLPMEMPTDAAFGRATMPTARAPGFAANRAGPSRSVGAGRRLRVPDGSGSRGCRLAVYWVVGPTAASRRRPAASLGARGRTDALWLYRGGVDRQRFCACSAQGFRDARRRKCSPFPEFCDTRRARGRGPVTSTPNLVPMHPKCQVIFRLRRSRSRQAERSIDCRATAHHH